MQIYCLKTAKKMTKKNSAGWEESTLISIQCLNLLSGIHNGTLKYLSDQECRRYCPFSIALKVFISDNFYMI